MRKNKERNAYRGQNQTFICSTKTNHYPAQFSPYPRNGYPDIKNAESTSNDGVEVVITGNSQYQ